ncbi:hypothetical protein [Streptomyces niveus]|uniref:hypothetical protein n=1 Tax=Streptomyces niveus TaxID=193462 RepID=UPI0036BF38BE
MATVHLASSLVIGAGALMIAFDYRSRGLRAYNLMAARSPGGGVDPRFSSDVLRVIVGVLGTVVLVSAGVRAFGLL